MTNVKGGENTRVLREKTKNLNQKKRGVFFQRTNNKKGVNGRGEKKTEGEGQGTHG